MKSRVHIKSVAVRKNIRQKGFSVIEVVMAIGVVAILLTGILAVVTPAQSSINNKLEEQRLRKLATEVEQEFSVIRPHESQSINHFLKTIIAIDGSDSGVDNIGSAYFVGEYNGDIQNGLDEGSGRINALGITADSNLGEDYLVVPIAFKHTVDGGTDFEQDIFTSSNGNQASGNLYMLRFVQLIKDGDDLVVSTEFGSVVDPENPEEGTTYNLSNWEDYPQSWIGLRAEFYDMGTSDIGSASEKINSTPDFPFASGQAGRPDFTHDFIITR